MLTLTLTLALGVCTRVCVCVCGAGVSAYESREKDGVARVHEILETTTWPAMEFKTALRPMVAPAAHPMPASAAAPTAAAAPAPAPPAVGAGAGAGSSTARPPPVDFDDDTPAGLTVASALHAAVSGRRDSFHSSDEEGDDDDDGTGADLQEFQALMSAISAAKSSAASVPDSQRRETAAMLAMRLMSMVGFDDDADED